MHFSKLRISADASGKLRFMRQRTGLTPNLLCRAAIMISLEEGKLGNASPPDEDGSEFNAYTLMGEYASLFASLVRSVEQDAHKKVPLDNPTLLRLIRSHIHRGVGILSVRAKSPSDLLKLVPSADSAV